MEPSRDAILAALANVIDPELRKPVTELDMVRGVEIAGGDVAVTIALTVAGCPLRSSFQDQVQQHVGSMVSCEMQPTPVESRPCSARSHGNGSATRWRQP